MTNFVSANQPYILLLEYPGTTKEAERYDNNTRGFPPDAGVTYIEIGPVPLTIRYAGYDMLFKGALTVIVQYAEEEVAVTVATLDGRISKTLQLGGKVPNSDVGVFRLYSVPELQAQAARV